jgi:hypothetical protein
MILLKLKDGVTVNLTDNSTITSCTTILQKFAELDSLKKEFTAKNLSSVEFGGVKYTGIVPVNFTVDYNYEDGNVKATFHNRFKTDMEVMQERLELAEGALQELIIGGM